MINNIELIKPLLKFESKDDFYYLQILQRKKENPEIGSNSRVIKNYYINSIEYLEDKYDEIIKLCEIFNARASIRLNKRSYKRIAFKTLENIANTMQNENEYLHIRKSYDRACGLIHNDPVKKWIIDIDSEDWLESQTQDLLDYIYQLKPVGNKYISEIPSKSGLHIITTPFNLEVFYMDYALDIHKDNPTNLYIP